MNLGYEIKYKEGTALVLATHAIFFCIAYATILELRIGVLTMPAAFAFFFFFLARSIKKIARLQPLPSMPMEKASRVQDSLAPSRFDLFNQLMRTDIHNVHVNDDD